MAGEIQPDNQTVRVLSMLLDGKNIADFSYSLKGTPCDNVAKKGFCLYPDNVTRLFPESKELDELNIRGYMGTPLRNSAGEVIGILCALFRNPVNTSQAVQEIVNIIAVKAAAEIEQMRMMTALQDSEEQYRLLAEQVHDGIYIYKGNRFLFVNSLISQITGYSKDELLAMNFFELIHPDDRAYVQEIAERRQRGEQVPNVYEIRVLQKNGSVLDVELAVSIILFRGEYAVLGAARDITDRKRIEEALGQVNKKLNLLSSITRHDILNQLMVLKGYIQLSREYLGDNRRLVEFLDKEEKAASTIEEQITFTRNYQEMGTRAPGWQNVSASITHAKTQLPLRDVRISVDRPDLEIFADPLFEKVFYNLIDNALRYGGDRMKTIRISSEESGQGLTIVCEDDGMGISPEDKDHLFIRGFGKNTGFGLFLSREILSITGIAIQENGEPGKGARFEITVPKGGYRISAGG